MFTGSREQPSALGLVDSFIAAFEAARDILAAYLCQLREFLVGIFWSAEMENNGAQPSLS